MNLDLNSIKEILNLGLGVCSFVVFVAGVYKAAQWGNALLTNHLAHLQSDATEIKGAVHILNEKTDKTNEILQRIADK